MENDFKIRKDLNSTKITVLEILNMDGNIAWSADYILNHIEEYKLKGLYGGKISSNYNAFEFIFADNAMKVYGVTIDEYVYVFNLDDFISDLQVIKTLESPEKYLGLLRTEEIKRLWGEFKKIPYPEEAHSNDFDLENIDTTIAGIVTSFIERGGQLFSSEASVLRSCTTNLKNNFNKIPLPAQNYFKKMMVICKLMPGGE